MTALMRKRLAVPSPLHGALKLKMRERASGDAGITVPFECISRSCEPLAERDRVEASRKIRFRKGRKISYAGEIERETW